MAKNTDQLVKEMAENARKYLTKEAKPIYFLGHLEPTPLDNLEVWKGFYELRRHKIPSNEGKEKSKEPETKKFVCSGC